jgi:hypothetical protein
MGSPFRTLSSYRGWHNPRVLTQTLKPLILVAP